MFSEMKAKKYSLLQDIHVVPTISIRSLHFKHTVEAAGIRDSKKKLTYLKQNQEGARHIQFKDAA